MKVTQGIRNPQNMSLMNGYTNQRRKIEFEEEMSKDSNNFVFEAKINDNLTIQELYTKW